MTSPNGGLFSLASWSRGPLFLSIFSDSFAPSSQSKTELFEGPFHRGYEDLSNVGIEGKHFSTLVDFKVSQAGSLISRAFFATDPPMRIVRFGPQRSFGVEKLPSTVGHRFPHSPKSFTM